ncbi:MAG: hypothetical protein LDL31_01190 [Prosthecobacter sp.]|jgi:hypothetical protein|nr:hypothetical protein [Prosthecobacter sp.]
MKTSLFIPLALVLTAWVDGHANQPKQTALIHAEPSHPSFLPRYELQALMEAARGVEAFIRRTPHAGARVWPHAVRDGKGRAGLIIQAHRPLLMTVSLEDIDRRKSWVLSAIIAAARQVELTEAPVDHLALTDTEGVTGQKWYYDVDIALARRVFSGLLSGTLSPDDAYATVIRSWKLVTADSQLAAR